MGTNGSKILKFIQQLCCITGLFILSSCHTQRLFTGDAQNNASVSEVFAKQAQLIQPDDKITLSIWDHEELSIGSLFGVYNSNEVYGKWVLVNSEGKVMLPKIGAVTLGGLTIQQATDTLTTLYSRLIVNPVIVLKVLNREVTVLGEVKSPGTLQLEKEYTSLVEVLGKVGGPEYYADARILKIIRGRDEQKKEYTLDLTRLSTIERENIWLQSGDIVYLPPFKRKSLQKEAGTLLPVAAILSSLAVFLTLVK